MPVEALVDVGDEADAAHLAVGDDVDAGLRLPPHGLGDGALDARRERRLVDRLAALLLQDHRPQIVGPRQAADMRGQDAIGAAFHDFLPGSCQQRSAERITSSEKQISGMIEHSSYLCLCPASHSSSFDQRRRPDTLRTAIATAFCWPTSTTSRLPRVTPV